MVETDQLTQTGLSFMPNKASCELAHLNLHCDKFTITLSPYCVSSPAAFILVQQSSHGFGERERGRRRCRKGSERGIYRGGAIWTCVWN